MKAGIIGAMDEEIEILKSKITSPTYVSLGEFTFISGRIGEMDTVLMKSGIGKVNAAIGATLLITYYNLNCVINTGTAGGIDETLGIGDVVISSEVRHHDVDATAFGYEYGQVPQMPPSYLPNKDLMDMASRCVCETIGKEKTVIGLIATGDSFIADMDIIDSVKKKMPEIKVIEMEAAAIAQTCHQFGKSFVAIRSVSDMAGKESTQSFKSNLKTASGNSASIVIELLKGLKKYEQRNERRSLDSIWSRKAEELKNEGNIKFYNRSQSLVARHLRV
ncbi:MAG: 5'-methylthioadenosine/adenosylhomocysteine nucleosidase [Desulfobacteraceae bacterium]|nr:5'-methylthioadenosine/adenosylhomocysteine nucleosidase [Desulfobacteraceae bacterium]